MDVIHFALFSFVMFFLHFVHPTSAIIYQSPSLKLRGSVAVDDLKTVSNNSESLRTVEFLRRKIKSMQENKKNDLVFLIDSSFSVGNANFRSEVKFVRKVLNGFKVTFNFTRVAVVPFSSSKKLHTIVDQISTPLEENDKCSLELKKIKFSGGGTNTYEAFLTAKRILSKSRKHSQKSILLITDGFSNGRSPATLANELKLDNITIVTFGVENGNLNEMRNVSSLPEQENCFILDSYQSFEQLSKKSLHSDYQKDSHMPRRLTFCDHLCLDNNSTGQCCDENAFCACGSVSGHYTCVCNEGYYGNGLSGHCHLCPNRTFWKSANLCKPCPDRNHIIMRFPATSIADCVCKPGFLPNEKNECEDVSCPTLSAPENGYLIGCDNVLNTACGIRCKSGYYLAGSSVRTCLADGNWSGEATSCHSKMCPALEVPQHANLTCTNENIEEVNTYTTEMDIKLLTPLMPIDTECSFKCAEGLILGGSSIRNCLVVSKWDGLQTTCRENRCNALPKPGIFGEYIPPTCTTEKSAISSKCIFQCPPGFEINGPVQKTCQGKRTGTWTHKKKIPSCIDIESPSLECPDNFTVSLKTTSFLLLDIVPAPRVKDNSGQSPTIWLMPDIVNKSVPLSQGIHTLTYSAIDSFKNTASCEFSVQVIDESPPVIENCNNHTFVLPAKCSDDSNKNIPECTIIWDEPIIYDNSNNLTEVIKKTPTRIKDSLIDQVIYTATDSSNNTNFCAVNITLKYEECNFLTAPINGEIECVKTVNNTVCSVYCQPGHAIVDSVTGEVEQNVTLICEHKFAKWRYAEVPDCAPVTRQNILKDVLSIEIDADGIGCSNGSDDALQLALQPFKESLCLPGDECEITFDERPKCAAESNQTQAYIDAANNDKFAYKVVVKREAAVDVLLGKGLPNKNKFTFQINRRRPINATASGPENPTNNSSEQLLSPTLLKRLHELNIRVSINKTKSSLDCAPGSILANNSCVQCSKGTYHQSSSNRCMSCDLGFYSSIIGQTSCQKCPDNQSTKKKGCKSINDCKNLCPPGTSNLDRSNRRNYPDQKHSFMPYCHKCSEGYYQPYYNQKTCLKCPLKYKSKIGSKSLDDCFLPKSYQACTTELNRCENQGQCVKSSDTMFQCKCNSGFYGWRCEHQIDPCLSGPCVNNGVCQSSGSQFSCKCTNEFEGPYCEETISKCRLGFCHNNGTCQELPNGEAECVCADGFVGEQCQTKHDHCANFVCEHGECLNTLNGYVCKCNPGYLGRRCHLQPCDYSPCLGNRDCINIMANSTNRSSYSCQCKEGFTGMDCTVKVKPRDPCESNPCQNNGNCESIQRKGKLSGFTCACPYYFFGPLCETLITPDFKLHFERAEVSNYVEVAGPSRNLSEISICVWIKTSDVENQGTILSYATASSDNMFTITDINALVVYVNGDLFSTGISLTDNTWHFICVTWMSKEGYYEVYLDGFIKQFGYSLNRGGQIEANGTLMIGQEQDSVGSDLSAAESFVGEMAYLDVWDRVLTAFEIQEMFASCDPFQGNLYSWSQFKLHVYGSIQILESTFCKMCEENLLLNHGQIRYNDNQAHYWCDEGYRIDGATVRQCGRPSIWLSPEPVCKPIPCNKLPTFKNGQVTPVRFNKVSYSCTKGFQLVGQQYRMCASNGSWIDPEPECKSFNVCPKLTAENQMRITYANEAGPYKKLLNEYPLGTYAEFVCPLDMRLRGETILTCMPDNAWDFPPPVCETV